MTINELIADLQELVNHRPETGEYKAFAKVRTVREHGFTEISHFRIQPMRHKESFVVLSGDRDDDVQ